MDEKCNLSVVTDDRAWELNDKSLVRFPSHPEEA